MANLAENILTSSIVLLAFLVISGLGIHSFFGEPLKTGSTQSF